MTFCAPAPPWCSSAGFIASLCNPSLVFLFSVLHASAFRLLRAFFLFWYVYASFGIIIIECLCDAGLFCAGVERRNIAFNKDVYRPYGCMLAANVKDINASSGRRFVAPACQRILVRLLKVRADAFSIAQQCRRQKLPKQRARLMS